MSESREIPSGWELSNLQDAVDVLDNLRKPINSDEREKRISGKEESELYPYYGATGQVGWIDEYITDGEYVLIGEDGAPFLDFYKPKAYIIKGKTWVNNHAHILRFKEGVTTNAFILHFLNQFNYNGYVNGTTRLKLTKSSLVEIPFPLPPLPEQHRIVAKIEELFSSLDKGIESLKTAQQQLKVYRKAVLKWAFDGKLTNKNVVEGKLPDGWKQVKLGEVADKITDGEHFRPKTQESGIPFLSAKDVRDEGVSFDHPLFISEETAKKAMQRCNPARGDILIVSRGATVGRMCIVKTENKFCLLGSVILIKAKSELNSQYLTYVLKSPTINEKLIAVSGATAQQAIYLRDIKSIELPIPLLSEQRGIVQEIESRLSICDKIEESIEHSLKQSEALRQSILKKAFEGKLVPQDPSDEPASVLLDRIKAEREQNKPGNSPRRQAGIAKMKRQNHE
jgi:type I restriction enzyme S subunit